MSDIEAWRALADDSDVVVAARVWADPAAPVEVLAAPSVEVLDHLVSPSGGGGVLWSVLDNPAVPDAVKTALAKRAKGRLRGRMVSHAVHDHGGVRLWLALAPAFTPAALERIVADLRFGWRRRHDEEADHERLAEVLRAFTNSRDARTRALAAQAFPLTIAARHHYAEGAVSAPRLAADPEVAVRVGLARNHHLRVLPEDEVGIAVRRGLLEDPAPRVRTAARRSGVHITDSHIGAVFAASHGLPVAPAGIALGPSDVLDDPAPAVRRTAVTAGIHRHDGGRWAQVLADPSPQVRKTAATHGWWTPRFVWTKLATDPDPGVRKAVAASRWVPPELQRRLLSDPEPAVADAAAAGEPLARSIRVPTGAGRTDVEVVLPVGHPSDDPQVHALDITAATLTIDQQHRLADDAAEDQDVRAEARDRVLHQLGMSRTARLLADRWIRWTSVFALPTPVPPADLVCDQLARPFQDTDTTGRVVGALALFDAALGVIGSPSTVQGRIDRAVLTAPWRHVCLPALHAADDVYGPRTPAARGCLSRAAALPRSSLDALLTARIGTDTSSWATARDEVIDAGVESGYPYRAQYLFWDAVQVAEAATGERPTDPLLADALWSAAASAVFAERVSPAVIDILTRPWNTAGLIQDRD